jgi:hypothetical protein
VDNTDTGKEIINSKAFHLFTISSGVSKYSADMATALYRAIWLHIISELYNFFP